MPNIIYSLVARGDVVLAHHASGQSGNFITVTSFLLRKIPSEDAQMSYEYDSYFFHYLVEKGITFLCLTEGDVDLRIAFAFLFDTKDRFFSRYNPQELPLRAFAVNSDFSKVLANQMDYFSHNPAMDKINQVKQQLEKTKSQMNQNIEKLLSREEKVELLVGRSGLVVDQSRLFQQQSQQVQWKIMIDNAKQYAFLVLLGGLIVWLVLSLFCGISLQKC